MTSTKKKGFFTLPVNLFILVVILSALYCGYWFVMSGVILKGANEWVDEQRTIGRTVSYSDMKVTGFPYRFVLDVEEPAIYPPDLRARREAETLQLIAMSWNLKHIIARSPGENTFELPNGQTLVASAAPSSAASFVLEDGNLRRIGIEATELIAQIDHYSTLTAGLFSLGLRPMPEAENNLQAALSFENLTLPAEIPDAEFLGQEITELVLWAEIENFYPLVETDLTFTEWKLEQNHIKLERGDLDMGPLDLSMRANVVLDRENDPDGTVSVYLERSEDLIAAIEEAGAMTPGLRTGIAAIALTSRNGGVMTVQVKDRQIRLLGQTLAEY